MPFRLLLSRSSLLILTVAAAAYAQDGAGRERSASDVHAEQLANCRAGILDPETTAEGRRRWIDNLLSYDTVPAKALVVELLMHSDNSVAQRAMCAAIARHARTHPERLDPAFVEPLMELLGSGSSDLRRAAAAALADLPYADVATKLGAIAARPDAPMDKRLSAIDAMVSRVHQREVIGELMALLDAGVPQITERVVAALEPISRETLGADLEGWRAWWSVKKQLSEEEWLTDQLRIFRDRVQDLSREMDSRLKDERHRRAVVTARLEEFQREVFRGLGPDQQETRLAEWLGAAEEEVRLVSLELIAARMADEGQRPGSEVRAALLSLLKDDKLEIRRAVLEIVQNLENKPAVVQAVLARIGAENEPALRVAIFRALGKLGSKEAVPDLIYEIASPHSLPEGVREAAIALGHIADGADDLEHVSEAVLALKARYKLESDSSVQIRAALLTAMAGVGDPAFAYEFLDAMESDDSSMLRPAIRGLRVIKERSKIPRLRTLTAGSDPLVRLAAVQAVGELGGDDADVEALLTRLNPAIEPNALVREAAWVAYRGFLAGKPAAEQLRHSERLRDTPSLEIKYLQELLADVTTTNGNAAGAEEVRDRLAAVLVTQRMYADALPHLRELYIARAARSDARSRASALLWLEASLNADPAGAPEVIAQITESGGDEAAAWIVEAVERHFESLGSDADIERKEQVLLHLESVPAERLGDEWAATLRDIKNRLAAGADEEPPHSP